MHTGVGIGLHFDFKPSSEFRYFFQYPSLQFVFFIPLSPQNIVKIYSHFWLSEILLYIIFTIYIIPLK